LIATLSKQKLPLIFFY